MSKGTTRPRGKRQKEIPGCERPFDPDLSAGASDLYELQTERIALAQRENDMRARLLDLMERKGMSVYVDEDTNLKVQVKEGKDKVSVRRHQDEHEGEKNSDADAAE